MSAAGPPPSSAGEPALTWFFGYGSLIWRPGFPWRERRTARLVGYHRTFCRYSFRHRGTPEQPGLVLGLHPGGICDGVVYGVEPETIPTTLAYLDDREGPGYLRQCLPVQPTDAPGPELPAWVYVPDPEHPTYFGSREIQWLVELVATGRGESGTALDYLRDLIAHLDEMGIVEPELVTVLRAAEEYVAHNADD